jgi:citronellol/citronellal dehydrogenase
MSKKVVFITGASRGVGLEIAKRFANDGAIVSIVAKTTEPHPKLRGTIWSARDEIINAGASDVLVTPCDIRNLEELKKAIDLTGEKYGKIDVLVNNASSIYLLKTAELPEKRYDLMHEVIVKGSLFATQFSIPYLEKSNNPHILNIAPRPDLKEKWFKKHTAYTLCKFASGMMVIGHAAEFFDKNIAVNALWPSTLLDTSAVENLLGGEAIIKKSRKPVIMADAAHYITSQDSKVFTGGFYLDEEIIKKMGGDLDGYSVVAGADLITDLYVEKA